MDYRAADRQQIRLRIRGHWIRWSAWRLKRLPRREAVWIRANKIAERLNLYP
jgi:hypothetical protein